MKKKDKIEVFDEECQDTGKVLTEEELVAKVLKDNMDNVVQLCVPLIAEVNAGKSWFDCK